MDSLVPISLIIILSTLSYILIGILERRNRNKFLGKIFKVGIDGTSYRMKQDVLLPYNITNIDFYFREYAIKLTELFFNKTIIKNLECVFEHDLHLNGHSNVKAYGSALTNKKFKFFDYLTFSKTRRIYIDATTIIEKDLNEKQIGQLVCHEYIHHLLSELFGDADGEHNDMIWKHLHD